MNKTLILALIIAIVLVGGGVGLLLKLQPTAEEQRQMILEGALREGMPEFEAMTKKIIAENDEENTWQSPLGTGGIMMNVAGKIRNLSDKTLTGLELRVSVLDTFGKPVKERTLIVVPTQKEKLEPTGEMNVVVRFDGFRQDDDRARIQWKVTAIKTEQ